jgi:hypothetical protein
MTIDLSGIGSAQVIALLPVAISSRINKRFLKRCMRSTRSICSHHSRKRASCPLVVIIVFLLSDTGTLVVIITVVIAAASQSEGQTKQDCGRNTHLCFLPSALLRVERQPAVHGCYRPRCGGSAWRQSGGRGRRRRCSGTKSPQLYLRTKADIERTGLRIQRDTGKKRL